MTIYFSEEIKANNIEMGRKLLAYSKMVEALRQIAKEAYDFDHIIWDLAVKALAAAGEQI